jgi:hypothetical protein
VDLLEEGNEVVLAASMEFVRTFSSTFKAGPAGGLRPPSGPATTR